MEIIMLKVIIIDGIYQDEPFKIAARTTEQLVLKKGVDQGYKRKKRLNLSSAQHFALTRRAGKSFDREASCFEISSNLTFSAISHE